MSHFKLHLSPDLHAGDLGRWPADITFDIRDGLLYVLEADETTVVAIFAPGVWQCLELLDKGAPE